jgi:hypothetical protein
MLVLTSASRFSVDRSTRGMNLDVKKMDVIVIKFVNSKLVIISVSSTYRLYNLIVPEFIRGLIISSSNSVMIILARVGPGDEPIETPSICL